MKCVQQPVKARASGVELQAGEMALDIGCVMVDSILVLIVKAHHGAFLYGR